jgi:hypothetical protein
MAERGAIAPFRQRALTAAVKATRAAGIERFRVEIAPDGTIAVIVPGAGDRLLPPIEDRGANEWDAADVAL